MNIKNIIFGLAIIILTSFVVIYGMQSFYPRPVYEDFCSQKRSLELANTQPTCEAKEGKWINYNYEIPRSVVAEEKNPTGYCDLDYYCRQDYEAESKKYSKNLFVMTVPIGIILLVIGAALFNLEAVGAGIMGGGIVTLIYGAGNYWPEATDVFRFIISLVGLIVVIFLTYWLNNRITEKKKSKFSLKFWKKK